MSRKSNHVKIWRQTTKSRIVEAFGGKCCICGYNKCNDALELHHIDPTQKECSISSVTRANIKSWETIVKELRKCVLICSNCHKELHCNVIQLPNNPPKFNEYFANYKLLKMWKKDEKDDCPICGKLKPKYMITCSRSCAAKRARKIDWDSIDIISMKHSGMSNISIADIVGVSDTSVRKRLRKLDYYT